MNNETEFELELMALFKKYSAEIWVEEGELMTLHYTENGEVVEYPIEFANENGICEF